MKKFSVVVFTGLYLILLYAAFKLIVVFWWLQSESNKFDGIPQDRSARIEMQLNGDTGRTQSRILNGSNDLSVGS